MQQRSKLDLLTSLDQHCALDKPGDTELAARLNSYERADRMQAAVPEAVDLSNEPEATKSLYRMVEEASRKYGTNCLRAVENRAHVHDIHATILHLFGFDNTRLTYLHNGREECPTINDGEVIAEALA